jgi:hypothetical protein
LYLEKWQKDNFLLETQYCRCRKYKF